MLVKGILGLGHIGPQRGLFFNHFFSGQYCTGFLSQGRAKLCAFPHSCGAGKHASLPFLDSKTLFLQRRSKRLHSCFEIKLTSRRLSTSQTTSRSRSEARRSSTKISGATVISCRRTHNHELASRPTTSSYPR